MNERDYLAGRFEEHRGHLRAVAYRMLGSLSEVDDAIQQAWLRLSRADTTSIENLGGWLTTVVALLDEGTVWPTGFALMKLTAVDDARIGALVKKAVS